MSAMASLEAADAGARRHAAELVALPAESVRARLRPWTVVTLFAWEASLALVVGTSVASVAGQAYGRHPDGDAPLFAPGSLALLDLLRHSVAAVAPVATTLFLVALLARLGGLLPAAVASTQMAFATARTRRAPSIRDVAARALGAVPAMFTVTMLAFALEATVVLLGVALAGSVSTWATGRFGEAEGDEAALGVGLVVMALAGFVGVGGDLAKASVVRNDARALTAVESSIAALSAHPIALPYSAAWRGAASLVPVALAATLTTYLTARGPTAMIVIAAIHQTVVIVRVAIRMSWMAKALRAVSRGVSPSATAAATGRPARSGAQGAPSRGRGA
jgi:hypothetical protein